ncbi:MAG TPA: M23 family metallopeptidase [Acidimicrobiia bacterium]|nr:M23 family metallopeptidase [Acidimicrobiia bacterium]
MRLFVFVVTLAIGIVVSPVLPAQADTTPPFEIVFPQEVSKTQFSSTYGASRSGGRRHNGNDLMATRMTEVYAVGDGTVIHVGVNRLSGRNVKIEHAEGWTSYYLHLNNDNIGTDDGRADWTFTVAPAIEVGMPVKAGQLIAWVGDSGNAEGTTPHTHFELRRNGRPINPYSILRDAFERGWHVEERLAASLVPAPGDYEIE